MRWERNDRRHDRLRTGVIAVAIGMATGAIANNAAATAVTATDFGTGWLYSVFNPAVR